MTEATGSDEQQRPQRRGEAAWKHQKEEIAERNAKARKVAKERRAEEDTRTRQRERAEELQERAAMHASTEGR